MLRGLVGPAADAGVGDVFQGVARPRGAAGDGETAVVGEAVTDVAGLGKALGGRGHRLVDGHGVIGKALGVRVGLIDLVVDGRGPVGPVGRPVRGAVIGRAIDGPGAHGHLRRHLHGLRQCR